MSKHSHARKIAHKKEAEAKKRGQIFSKLAREIFIAVREGGPNPEANSRLVAVLEKARSFNMPNENVQRAIERALGKEGEKLEEVLFEGYGPEGIAVIVEGITDNKNRAVAEIKNLFSKFNGKVVPEGSIRWMFERKGCLRVKIDEQKEEFQKKEDLELLAIEAGGEDLDWDENTLEIYTKIEDLQDVKKILLEKGVKVEEESIDWIPKQKVKVPEEKKEKIENFFEALDELDFVNEIYSNLE